ncbi:sugar ABC transporter substrate-binding protein [Brotaphodocola catenula]|uniref:Sugar ABC transporter substrate-binding protein n=1 Tax=Brotaphodocola catenula TaxID=2885361 RepID=A0AAE3AQ94_9FIRM|nr:sugar ABC transporter substrate-binding protein [Brotaphodocola catenula]MCC2163957.1 sugar ABC transporter substrate-binding protein [Brotaphodocola catenula]
MEGRRRSVLMGMVGVILLIVGIWFFMSAGKMIAFYWAGRKFGATYMTMNNPFYEIIDDEIRNALEANGDMLLTRDPALDVEKQINQIREFVDLNVSGIFVNPVDWKEITPALEEAKKAGIPVIVVDSDVYDDDLVRCTMISDNYRAGQLCAQHLMETRESAKILLLSHSVAKSGIDRIQGFKDALADYPQYQILDEADCLGQLELAMPATEKLLEEHPDADVIMCLNDLAAMGSMAALKEQGKDGKILVYGVDGSPDGKGMIAEGIMTATSAQFPRKIGRMAADVIYRFFDGEEIPKRVLVQTELVTIENLEEYGTDGWQ